LVVVLMLAGQAWALDVEMSRRTLTGLAGFHVVVEDYHVGMQKYDKALQLGGLTKTQIQERVEKQLRAAGIRIVSGKAWLDTPGRPILYVNVNMHETDRYNFAYGTEVSVQQIVTLNANPATQTMASTWSLRITGSDDVGNLKLVAESIRDLVGRFIQAYREANAKR